MVDEERYNNRQIERMFDEQKTEFRKGLESQSDDLKEHIDLALKPILEQVTKTNGRVTKLEDKSIETEKRMSRVDGALVVISLLVPTVIGFFTWLAIKLI